MLSPPESIGSTPGTPPQQAGLAVHPRHSSPLVVQGNCFSSALTSLGPLDALSLISLHCSNLESEPIEFPEASGMEQERPSSALFKNCHGNHLWTAGMEEPRAVQLQGPGPKSQHGRKRASRKQPRPRRSCESRDPAFQGVTVQMQLCQNSSEGCRLLISTRYSRYSSWRAIQKYSAKIVPVFGDSSPNKKIIPREPRSSFHSLNQKIIPREPRSSFHSLNQLTIL